MVGSDSNRCFNFFVGDDSNEIFGSSVRGSLDEHFLGMIRDDSNKCLLCRVGVGFVIFFLMLCWILTYFYFVDLIVASLVRLWTWWETLALVVIGGLLFWWWSWLLLPFFQRLYHVWLSSSFEWSTCPCLRFFISSQWSWCLVNGWGVYKIKGRYN